MNKIPALGVKGAIEAAGGTQKHLAAALGVSQNAISKWSLRGWMPTKRAKQTAERFGVALGSLTDPRLAVLQE